ncbi:hypothetical protein K491DRAFT_675420 [Lophiostoma macrostomum CBS 122681]|uniref:Uncharacterized protein n=1 Tax=Lophiostoma macrostomum CBS 122681 TaxID=1314788 RepID=A0A6A6TLA0_9PLEO|nr:hypothetical protein K491DRAFT_675420 [Lophiostoma macrostomum CBS 122681]
MSAPPSQSLGEVPVCVAIDRSGSTYGQVLQVEIGAVQSICSLMSPRNESPVRVLPWCDQVLDPISLPKQATALQHLTSSGGTDPSVLYSSAACLEALSASGLWFLLTDGEIEDGLVENFALKTAQHGLHGLACIVIVFGSTMRGPPAACNISVGIATYAVSPDCLFLFHDVSTGRLSILQAKGCFKELLPRYEQTYKQPDLSKYTKWADLPLISYQSLSQVKVPPPRKVAVDELALQDNLVIRMQDIYSGNVDPDYVYDLMRNEDNMKSMLLAEATKGASKDLAEWLQSQKQPLPAFTSERPDINEQAQHTVMKLLEAMRNGASDEKIQTLQSALRVAHAANWQQFQKVFQTHVQERNRLSSRNTAFGRVNRQSITWDDNLKKNRGRHRRSSYLCEDAWARDESDEDSDYDEFTTPTRGEKLDLLFLPGFERCHNVPGSEFVGPCMLCRKESPLAILLKSPPHVSTPNFPRRNSHTALLFPLAMSRFAETDIMSFFICCDSCALYLVRNCVSPLSDTVTGALALVSLEKNKTTWLETLDSTFNGRFNMSDLPTLFLAVLDKKILENKFRSAIDEHKSLYHRALQWAKGELSGIAEVSDTLSPSLRPGHRGGNRQKYPERTLSLSTVISNRALFDPAEATNADISMLRYAIDGFPVLIRLLEDQGVSQQELQKHTFQRLVFYLTEVHLPTLKKKSPEGKQSNLPEMLHRLASKSATTEPQLLSRNVATNASVEDIFSCDLLDAAALESFRTLDQFGNVERQTGPAIAVYLHALSAYGKDFSTPKDFFNAMKVSPWLKKAIHMPFGISEGLAADLALQIPDRPLES